MPTLFSSTSFAMARYDLTPVLEDSFRCFKKPCECDFCPSVTKGRKRPLRETNDERANRNSQRRHQRLAKKVVAEAKKQVKKNKQSTITSFFTTESAKTGGT